MTDALLWPMRSLAEAARRVGRHPFGVLVPAGGALVAQAVGVVWARETYADEGPIVSLVAVLVASVVASVLAVPLRAATIGAGAVAGGRSAFGVERTLPLLGVEIVVAPLVALAAAVVLLPTMLVVAGLAMYGWLATAAVVLAVGAVVAQLGALLVRSAFAFAPALVVVEGRSGLGALRDSLARMPTDLCGAFVVLLAGDLLVAVGGLLCGFLALPAWPLSDLALVHRLGQPRG